jgi:hypothetical protein
MPVVILLRLTFQHQGKQCGIAAENKNISFLTHALDEKSFRNDPVQFFFNEEWSVGFAFCHFEFGKHFYRRLRFPESPPSNGKKNDSFGVV